MAYQKLDGPLRETLTKLSESPEERIIVVVRIRKEDCQVISEVRMDEKEKKWPVERYIVPPEIQQYISQLSTRVLFNNFEIIPAMSVETEVGQLGQIAEYGYVELIELSTKAELSLYDAERITHAEAVRKNIQGGNALVSIIDTGINDYHQLKKKIVNYLDWTYEGEVDRYVCGDPFGHYEHGHGTAVATAIAYIAPDAKFLNAKAIHAYAGPHSSPDKANVLAAIDWSQKKKANIINLSGGFNPCPDGKCSLCLAADNVVKTGVVFVTAAGNGGKTPVNCPAQAREVITVAASTKSDLMWEHSNKGPTNYGGDKPDIVAPGEGILTGCSSGGMEHRTGTSFSAAIITGAVALLREKNTFPQDIKKAILDTARKLTDPDTGNPYPSTVQGRGRVNIEKAYAQL